MDTDFDRGFMEKGKLVVQFYMGAMPDKEASAKEGRPIFKDVPFTRIIVPGERDIYDQPTWLDEINPNAHNNRFPEEWRRFKSGEKDPVIGMPLDQWPPLLKSQVEELRAFRIRTVEQLANVSDGNLQRLGAGYLMLRQKAQEFIKAAKERAPLEKVQAELQSRDAQIAALQAQVQQLINVQMGKSPAVEAVQLPARTSIVAEASASPKQAPKKRGRPAKALKTAVSEEAQTA